MIGGGDACVASGISSQLVAIRPLASLAIDGVAREGRTSCARLEIDLNRATARWEAALLYDEFERGGGGWPLPQRSHRGGMRGRRASGVPRWAHGEGRWREKRCHITCCLRLASLDSKLAGSVDHMFSRADLHAFHWETSSQADTCECRSEAVLFVHLFFSSVLFMAMSYEQTDHSGLQKAA